MHSFSIRRRLLLGSILVSPIIASAAENELDANFAYDSVIKKRLLIIDIRTPHEWRRTGIPQGAHGIDMESDDFFEQLLELAKQNPNRKIALISTTGGRSAYLTRYLARRGVFVYDISGGVIGKSTSWKSRKLPFKSYPSRLSEN